jgi:hypothetical protein
MLKLRCAIVCTSAMGIKLLVTGQTYKVLHDRIARPANLIGFAKQRVALLCTSAMAIKLQFTGQTYKRLQLSLVKS